MLFSINSLYKYRKDTIKSRLMLLYAARNIGLPNCRSSKQAFNKNHDA